ncbi:MAG: hypothetical protein R3D85_11875 [Paracoccaceae bacterium]
MPADDGLAPIEAKRAAMQRPGGRPGGVQVTNRAGRERAREDRWQAGVVTLIACKVGKKGCAGAF